MTSARREHSFGHDLGPAVRITEVVPGAEVHLSGRIDVLGASHVREVLHRAVDGGTGDLLVHLDAVEVIDAAGLGVLVGVHRRARRSQRRLVLIAVPPRIERLIKHTRLHRVLVRSPLPLPAWRWTSATRRVREW